MTAPLAGQIVRASAYPRVRVIQKAANESVTSSTVMQNDDDFSVSLEAGKIWAVRAILAVSGAAAGDVKIAWVVTGGAAGTTRSCVGPTLATADASAGSMRASRANLGTAVAYGVDGTLQSSILEEFLVETTTSNLAGTLTMQWAQNASSATPTIVQSTSYVLLTEVDPI